MLYANHWDYWLATDKCTFDGVARTILVNPGVTTLDIRTDVYSRWIDWVVLLDHTKFTQAIRFTGFDPMGGGVYTGDVYFLVNGWKFLVDLTKVKITGVLLSDDYDTAYYSYNLIPQYPVTVSALVNTVVTTNTVPVVTGDVNALTTQVNLLTAEVSAIPTPPSASTVATAVRVELNSELTKITNQLDGLTPSQATMLLEIYKLYGLDANSPLVVTDTARTAGTISQNITSTSNQTTITRV